MDNFDTAEPYHEKAVEKLFVCVRIHVNLSKLPRQCQLVKSIIMLLMCRSVLYLFCRCFRHFLTMIFVTTHTKRLR